MAAVESGFQPFPISNDSGVIPYNLPLMETPPRPSSALARGVHITECKDPKVNPEPLVLEESEFLLEDFLSPRKLRALTGVDDLEEVHFLEMKVDTRETSLGNFGMHLPNMSQLKLSNSVIVSLRDIGSCLNNLRVLWMARCGLEDIDGLSSLNSLKELYLAYNEIYDISPCSMLENLQILDLEGNNIDEIAQIEFLALCSSLRNLTLEGNPVCVTPSPDSTSMDYNYRSSVKRAVPQLGYLDDEQLVEDESENKVSTSVFDDDWKLIEELMEDSAFVGTDESVEAVGRPGTAIKPMTGYRPGSALKQLTTERSMSSRSGRPGTGGILRPGSASNRPASGRPGSGNRPGSTRSAGSGDSQEEINDASELTLGGVICGNPSKALRARQRSNEPSTLRDAPQLYQHLRHKPEHTYDAIVEDDDALKELVSELKEWKVDHQRKAEEIESSKAPQVLRIDFDDAISLSSDEEEEAVDSEPEEDEGYATGKSRIINPDEGSNTPSPDNTLAAFGGARPKTPSTSSAVRSRRYRRLDMDMLPNGAENRRTKLQHDESFDAPEDMLIPTPPSPECRPLKGITPKLKSQSIDLIKPGSPIQSWGKETDARPNSGPVIGTRGKFKLEPMFDKREPKVIDRANPIIRASLHSPDKNLPEGPRADTAKAVLQHPQVPVSRIRKLTNVPLLPSKTKFSK